MLVEHSLLQRLSRLEAIESQDAPILSLYLDLRPGRTEMRTIAPRLRDLVAPLRETVGDLDHGPAESLKQAIDAVLGMEHLLASEAGRGVAVFQCPAIGLDERLSIRHRLWDRAIVGRRPYLRPLRAVLDSGHPSATVVVDARNIRIMVTAHGEMLSYEMVPGEEVRKADFPGWYALEESKSRRSAAEARHHLFRDAAQRLAALRRDLAIEAIFAGGRRQTVEEFLPFLGSREATLVVRTFTTDVHTTSDSDVQMIALDLSAEWDRTRHESLGELIRERAASGGLAATGLPAVLAAANRHAVAELLVSGTGIVTGFRCQGCDGLELHGPVCAVCGGVGDEVADVVEELISAVLDGGGTVAIAPEGTKLDGELVGALLRYRTD